MANPRFTWRVGGGILLALLLGPLHLSGPRSHLKLPLPIQIQSRYSVKNANLIQVKIFLKQKIWRICPIIFNSLWSLSDKQYLWFLRELTNIYFIYSVYSERVYPGSFNKTFFLNLSTGKTAVPHCLRAGIRICLGLFFWPVRGW